MDNVIHWIISDDSESQALAEQWNTFLQQHPSDLSTIKNIQITNGLAIITDLEARKLSIDFLNNSQNYAKKKGSRKTELISKALGAGRYGLQILDLSAGLGIDAIFLAQLGYQVTALERNPLLFLALHSAWQKLSSPLKESVNFEFASAKDFIKTTLTNYDVIYFDPMFPEKKKSALPRQEMLLFRDLVGTDEDASDVIAASIESKKVKRVVVKRPLKAPLLFPHPQSQVEGKLIRFDVYGVHP